MSDELLPCYECDNDAAFWVEEAWQEDGARIEFFEPCCMDHVPDPEHYEDGAFINYTYSIDPIAEYFGFTETTGI